MIKSNYLTIEIKKMPNSSGIVTTNECILVSTNSELENVKISYKYMYL